ncbi:MAG: helix-turn-helix domain-containing protein, partial [Candidatus Korobacteraceae bacterium]
SDLFYRLNVFPVSVPPLRERVEDIPLLARYFTSKYARRLNRELQRIPAETLDAMTRYSWPGNVRELQNFIERAVILSRDGELHAPVSELVFSPPSTKSAEQDESRTLRELERVHILEALEKSHWVVGGPMGAAARLGMKRTSLIYRMVKLRISRLEAADA